MFVFIKIRYIIGLIKTLNNNLKIMAMTEIERKKIFDTISLKVAEKGVVLECPLCKGKRFVLFEGYGKLVLQDDLLKGIALDGAVIPEVLLACEHCGNILHIAAGALGLLDNKIEGVQDVTE